MRRLLHTSVLFVCTCLLTLSHAVAQQPTGIIETIAGAVPFQSAANATTVGIGAGGAVVMDASGNLYTTAIGFNVVLRIDPAGNASVYAGVPMAAGPFADSGDGGPATSAHLAGPQGLAVDAAGDLYISDISGPTVRRVDAKTGMITTVAGVSGKVGAADLGDGGLAAQTPLGFPTALAVDAVGDLFIVDGQFIRRVDAVTGVLSTIAGTIYSKAPCSIAPGQGCPGTSVIIGVDPSTACIAVRGSHLYLASQEFGYPNDQTAYRPAPSLLDLDLTTDTIQLIAGGGLLTTSYPGYPAVGDKHLYPTAVAADAQGNLFFGSSFSQIYRFDQGTHAVTLVAGTGQAGPLGDGGPATAASLNVYSMAVSLQGQVVVRSYARIRSFTVGSNITTVAGNGFLNDFGDGGLAPLAGVSGPNDLAFDAAGHLLLADSGNGAIRQIDSHTGVITTIVGSTPSNAAPVITPVFSPDSINPGSEQEVFILSGSDLIGVDPTHGTFKKLVDSSQPGSGLWPGSQIAADGHGLVYATLNTPNHIVSVDTVTGAQIIIAGSTLGSGGPVGDGGPAIDARLGEVTGLALDGNGTLYLSDTLYNVIRAIDLKNGTIRSLTQPSSGGYAGDGGPATAALLHSPRHIAVDGAGHLLIADTGNAVIRSIDLRSGMITTLAGNGTLGYSGDGGPATKAQLFGAVSVTADTLGDVYISDAGNLRVRRVLLHPTKLNAALTASATTASAGSPVTLSASYSNLSFGFAPTGTVQFLNGATVLGSADLPAAPDASGNYTATFTTSALATGNASVTSSYAGDVHYAAVTSAPVAVTVGAPAAPTYTVAANPGTLTVKQGGTGSLAITVTPQNGFNQAVTFNCDATSLPQGVSCAFSPASVTPNGVAATTTLTVSTTAATAKLAPAPLLPEWLPRGGAVLALLFFGVPVMRRKSWPAALCLLVLALGAIGCGGSSGASTPPPNASATPAGTYTIRLNATAGAGSAAASQPVNVTITVTN